MWQYQNTDELYHYGIPGMRWGSRRAQKILGSSDASVDKKKKAVQSLQKHQIKINKQISKLNKKDEQLLSNRDVQIRKSAGKMMNYKERKNSITASTGLNGNNNSNNKYNTTANSVKLSCCFFSKK